MKIKKREKVITKTKAKALAWKYFSLYIRQKFADKNGYVQCFTCSTVKPIKNMQAGHGLGGRHNSVLFMEEFVRPQCVGCNMYAGGRYAVFTKKLMDEYGSEKYYELVRQANKVTQYTVEDYLAIAERYQNKLNDLPNI